MHISKLLGFIICERGIIFKVHVVFIFQNECPRCNKFFSTKSNLQKHINKVHLKTEIFKCDSCHYTTTRKHDLIRHSASVHNSESKKLKCEWCLYETNKTAYLERHIRACKGNPDVRHRGTKRQQEEQTDQHLQIEQEGQTDEQPRKKQLISCDHCDYTTFDTSHISARRSVTVTRFRAIFMYTPIFLCFQKLKGPKNAKISDAIFLESR